MPEREIPCVECEAEKKRIEEAGDAIVIGCEPIPDKPEWCQITWKFSGNPDQDRVGQQLKNPKSTTGGRQSLPTTEAAQEHMGYRKPEE